MEKLHYRGPDFRRPKTTFIHLRSKCGYVPYIEVYPHFLLYPLLARDGRDQWLNLDSFPGSPAELAILHLHFCVDVNTREKIVPSFKTLTLTLTLSLTLIPKQKAGNGAMIHVPKVNNLEDSKWRTEKPILYPHFEPSRLQESFNIRTQNVDTPLYKKCIHILEAASFKIPIFRRF